MSAPTTVETGVLYGPVDAEPYNWPFDGGFRPERTALINIDWQVDFCGIGGYVDRMGYDLNLTRANDMGFECLLVVDACAPGDEGLVAGSVSMIEMSGGIFGAVGVTARVAEAYATTEGEPE